MNKKYIFSILISVFLVYQTEAKVWRVCNRLLDTDPDFTSLSTAISTAADGDTLYVLGSPTSYGSISLNKKLIIIGPGYWLDVNDTTQVYKNPAVINQISFSAGSEESVIEGMKIYTSSSGQIVDIRTDSITLRKNYIENHYTSSSARTIYIEGVPSGITIEQNWILKNTAGYVISITNYLKNSIIRNNMLKVGTGGYAIYCNQNSYGNQLTVNNNILGGKVHTQNALLFNNILMEGDYEGSDDVIYNCLCNGTQFPDENNNQQNVDMSTVFVDNTGTVDKDFMLKDNSPAIGAGYNGGDCGMFGYGMADTPYVLSGLPPVPAIFEIDSYYAVSGTHDVEVKATSHNAHK